MSLTLQLGLGMTALLTLLGGLVGWLAHTFGRELPEDREMPMERRSIG